MTTLAIRALIAAAILAALTTAYFGWRGQQREIGRQEVRAEWALDRETRKNDAIRRAEENARETLRRMARQQEAQDAHDKQLAAAVADARRAATAAAGLREQLAAFTAAARSAPGNPSASGNGPPAGDPIGVLAGVLRRADERAGVLAEFADRAHLAGQLCERAYDGLR